MIIPIGDENPTTRFPIVHYIIIGINCLVYLLINFRPDFNSIVREFGFTPANHEFGTLFTSMFMHADIFHILGNMLFLWIFGDNVEDALGWLYAPFYLACGISASLMHYALFPESITPCVGASGAISGILGFYLVLFPWHKVKFFFFWYYRSGVFHLEAVWAIGFWFLLQLLYGTLFLSVKMVGGVAYWAHIGGFLFGFIVAIIWKFLVLEENAPITKSRKTVIPSGRYLDPNAVLTSLNAPGTEDDFLSNYKRHARMYGDARLNAENHLRAGEIMIDKNGFRDAGRIYKTFLLLNPEHEQAQKVRYYLGELLIHKLNQPQKGMSYLRQLVSKPTENQDLVDYARKELNELELKFNKTTTGKKADQLSGSCMVIRQTADKTDNYKIAEVVAKVTGRVRFDVIREIEYSHGIIAKKVTIDQAKALADYLQANDVPVLILDESDIVELPPSVIVISAELNDKELTIQTGVGQKRILLDDVILAVAGRLVIKKRELSKDDEGAIPHMSRVLKSPVYRTGIGAGAFMIGNPEPEFSYKDVPANEFVLSIITKDLKQKYLFSSERSFVKGFANAPQYVSRIKGLSLLSGRLLKIAEIKFSPSLSYLANEDFEQGTWLDFTFNSQYHMDEYTLWLFHLYKYD